MANLQNDDLFPEVRNPHGTCVINQRCLIRTQEGYRVVLVSGMPLAQYAVVDRMSEAHAIVSLVDQGWADQNDVAKTFGYSVRTMRRYQRRFEEEGLSALARSEGYPQGRARMAASRQRWIQRLKAQGYSHCEIARRMGVSVRAIRKTLRRLGWEPTPVLQAELALTLPRGANPNSSASGVALPSPIPGLDWDPNLSAFSATSAENPPPHSFDTDPSDRSGDRLLARLGLLDDAAPLFGCATAIPRAGVLLALPALVGGAVFECAQQIYGSLGPAFYGLRTSLLTLLLMALWRIKRPEALKEYSPTDLGRVLGLDRAPEVKTLRRKLARL